LSHPASIRKSSLLRGTLFLSLLLLLPAAAVQADSVAEALKDGDVQIDLRYRFELVDQDGFMDDAEASTLRLRLGYETGRYHGMFAMADFESIHVIGGETYNSTANGLGQYPVVADPEGEELNQAYLGYDGLKGTTFKLGRQRIILDNARFVGNVGWRQNEQTFDAFSVVAAPGENCSLIYAHLNNANRIFGEDHPVGAMADTNLAADLLNASYNFKKLGKLTGYAYLFELEDAPAASHQNIGLRFNGKRKVGEKTVLTYGAEYADQSDYEDGASTIDAEYYRVDLGVKLKRVGFAAGYELLGGDGVYAFQTPLATLHAFNGWTDQFLSTPATGLEDTFFSVSSVVAKIKLKAVYHDFAADTGGMDYGSELGLVASRSFRKMYTVALKYASFDSDGYSVDTDKLWVTLQLKR
jgi:hypothetical protein